MNTFINSLSNIAETDNGATTFKSSLNKCLDLFFIAGASRFMSEGEIIKMFKNAYGQNPVIAMMILFGQEIAVVVQVRRDSSVS